MKIYIKKRERERERERELKGLKELGLKKRKGRVRHSCNSQIQGEAQLMSADTVSLQTVTTICACSGSAGYG